MVMVFRVGVQKMLNIKISVFQNGIGNILTSLLQSILLHLIRTKIYIENTILMILPNKYDPNSGQPVETLGDVLLYVRKKTLGWSRAELTKRTGIPSNSISKYELAGRQGGQYPPIPKLTLLCAIMEIDVRVLLSYSVKEKLLRENILKADIYSQALNKIHNYPDQDLVDQAAEECENIATENVVAEYLGDVGHGKKYAIKSRFFDRYGQLQQEERIFYLGADAGIGLDEEQQETWNIEKQAEKKIFTSMHFAENNESPEGYQPSPGSLKDTNND